MKVNCVGIQNVDFTDQKSGEVIQGTKLHLVGIDPVDMKGFTGCEVSTVFIRKDSPLISAVSSLPVPCTINLTYNERVNGKRYLCDIKKV